MKQLTFLELAKRVLEEEKRPLSPEEIWEVAKIKGYDKEIGSKGKTPFMTIGARLYIDIRDNKNSVFEKVDGTSPRKFHLRSLNSSAIVPVVEKESQIVNQTKKLDYLERDLHPFLAYFAFYYLRAYTKTIFHEKSEKKSYGEWVHPDMVGCYFPLEEWKPEVFEFSSVVGNVAIKLFSFEIKRELNFTNLRESFFQAVSNSSWANESYLVSSKISGDEDFLNELKRLSASFGIGVISLDIYDPDSSEIIFPANNRENLDWETINKLAAMNSEFRNFLKRIKNDISGKEIRKELYDRVLTKEKLLESIHNKVNK
jgi:uncharacterized protein